MWFDRELLCFEASRPCKGYYSANVLKNGRILVSKKGSASDDSIWFLEVDSPFVRRQSKLLGKEYLERGSKVHFSDKTGTEKEITDGTSIESVVMRCILDINVQGAMHVKASSLYAIFILVCPPLVKELEDRLCASGTETEEQIQKRLRDAEAEIT
ncbi:unnamed protein product [Arabis nemorensis]|uniref:Guanylate kinase-like domain-containing protein n=1 Tax=Arabis nemorensis TaxID=586526 RepID=A0A565BU95_9BRAS|nr:unnamed protein product [Arabis nemorensis]